MRAHRTWRPTASALAAVLGLLVAAGCGDDQAGPTADASVDGQPRDTGSTDAGVDTTADRDVGPGDGGGLVAQCPGSAGCADNSGELLAGAAAVAISPTAYEVPRVAYLGEERACPAPTPLGPFGLPRCGKLVKKFDAARADCGLDGLCPGDALRTRLGCDAETACPAPMACNGAEKRCYLEYAGPDADGSEGDGVDDWFLDCGRDRVCPCLDPAGEPAYFGAGDECLAGHATNPAYAGPDADGSEGNGSFDGIWFGGFTSNLPMLGKHDDVWARALVLRSGATTVAIVSLDLVGVFHNDVQRLRAKVIDKLGAAEVDYVLVSATHNHEGPDTLGQWGPEVASGVDKAYFAELIDKTAQAVIDATAALKKVKLTAGEIGTGAAGYLRDSRDPQIFNDRLIALKLDDAASGETVATLVNWSNHPEVLANTNNYLTSDFPHYLRQGLEQAIPAAGEAPALPALGGVAIYLQGTVGGLMTPLGVAVPARDGTVADESDWLKAEALGVNLAVKAREALAAGEAIASPELSVWAKQLTLDVDNNTFILAFVAKIFDREPINEDGQLKLLTEVALLRLGPVTLFSFPGEVAPEIVFGGFDGSRSLGRPMISDGNDEPPVLADAPKGPYLIDRLPGKYKLPVGLGNDELGYILPAYNFRLGDPPYLSEAKGDHYEETNSLGPGTEAAILAAYDELLPLAGK